MKAVLCVLLALAVSANAGLVPSAAHVAVDKVGGNFAYSVTQTGPVGRIVEYAAPAVVAAAPALTYAAAPALTYSAGHAVVAAGPVTYAHPGFVSAYAHPGVLSASPILLRK